MQHPSPLLCLPRRPAPRHVVRGPDAEFEVSSRRSGFGLRFAVSGRPGIDQLISTLHVFGIRSESSAKAAMLIDLRGVQTEYGRAELVSVGHEIACSFTHLTRLALLVQPHRVTRISERAAQRSGMNVRVFDLEPLAVDWLRLAAARGGALSRS